MKHNNPFVKSVKCVPILLLFGFSSIASAQTPDIGKEIEELKQGQQAIQKKLQDIESLLEKIATQPPMRPAPPSGPVIKDVLNTATIPSKAALMP